MISTPDRIALERTFTQGDFDLFAELSGDDNPIHVDPEFSARSRFGRTVSHGVLLSTVLRGLIAQLAPGGRQTKQLLEFRAPTYADEPMRFEAAVSHRDAATVGLELRITRIGDGVVTCEGSTTLAREVER